MRIFSLVLLAAGLALAPPAFAADKGARPGAAPVVAPSSDPGAQLVADVAQYTSVYQTLLGDSSMFFGLYMDGAQRALSGPRGDTGWVEGWTADMRARQAALRARRAALAPPPAALIARIEAAGLAEDAKEIKATPQRMGGAVDAVLDLCDQVLALVPDAARGDEAARAKLTKTLTRGSRTAIASENAMMEGALVRMEPGNPQGALMRSILASNSAIMALMDLSALLDETPKADPSALVKSVLDNLATARSEAQKAGPLAQRAIVQLNASSVEAGFKARLIMAMGTYDESGQVEVQIVDTIQAMLSAEDPAKIQSLNQELGGLVQRRLKLQTDRQAMLGG